MRRLIAAVLALAALALAGPAAAAPKLERVVIVMRHGIRPPTMPNADIAKYAARPWPDWPVPAGDLTPHGGQAVALMANTVRAAYVRAGLLPAKGCTPGDSVNVWADGANQRTEETGRIMAKGLEPGCQVPVGFVEMTAPARDPIFGLAPTGVCAIDDAKSQTFMATEAKLPPEVTAYMGEATDRLQAILAPTACNGGPGTCLTDPKVSAGMFPPGASLAEDIYLEYADGKPMSDVGWGMATRADIDDVMKIHERSFGLIRANVYANARRGSIMARQILDALDGKPLAGGPKSGPDLKLLVFSGHDSNLSFMASVFGLDWTLPGQPEGTAPATTLAFERWRDGAHTWVKPVLYYETLDQLRNLTPAMAKVMPLSFEGCADGPMGACPVEKLRQRVEAVVPTDCGVL
jgi:4-phytase/acid phosphatase